MNSFDYIAIPVVVALISGIVSFIGLVIFKENKISEFRQSWIDELRKDISDFISYTDKHTTYCIFVRSHMVLGEDPAGVRDKILDLYKGEYHIVNTLYTRIVLRLNHIKHKDILECLHESQKLYYSSVYNDMDNKELGKSNSELRDKAGVMLKKEWERVKAGEHWFRATKYIVLGVVIILLITVVVGYFFGKKETKTFPRDNQFINRMGSSIVK